MDDETRTWNRNLVIRPRGGVVVKGLRPKWLRVYRAVVLILLLTILGFVALG